MEKILLPDIPQSGWLVKTVEACDWSGRTGGLPGRAVVAGLATNPPDARVVVVAVVVVVVVVVVTGNNNDPRIVPTPKPAPNPSKSSWRPFFSSIGLQWIWFGIVKSAMIILKIYFFEKGMAPLVVFFKSGWRN